MTWSHRPSWRAPLDRWVPGICRQCFPGWETARDPSSRSSWSWARATAGVKSAFRRGGARPRSSTGRRWTGGYRSLNLASAHSRRESTPRQTGRRRQGFTCRCADLRLPGTHRARPKGICRESWAWTGAAEDWPHAGARNRLEAFSPNRPGRALRRPNAHHPPAAASYRSGYGLQCWTAPADDWLIGVRR